jgi:hypothetical protein
MRTVVVTLFAALLGVALAAAAVCGAAMMVYSGRVAQELMRLQRRIDRRYRLAPEVLHGATMRTTVRAVTLLVGAGWVFAGVLGLNMLITGRGVAL